MASDRFQMINTLFHAMIDGIIIQLIFDELLIFFLQNEKKNQNVIIITLLQNVLQQSMYGPFLTIVSENLANRGESSRISVNSCPIRAAFGIFLTDS